MTAAIRIRLERPDHPLVQACGEIKRVMVWPERRGQRLAEQILRTLGACLFAGAIALALLETRRDQTKAVHLYRCCGRHARGSFAGHVDNGLSQFLEKRFMP
jgi:ribosomal protein S18 acetylase RimI-like enzyme